MRQRALLEKETIVISNSGAPRSWRWRKILGTQVLTANEPASRRSSNQEEE